MADESQNISRTSSAATSRCTTTTSNTSMSQDGLSSVSSSQESLEALFKTSLKLKRFRRGVQDIRKKCNELKKQVSSLHDPSSEAGKIQIEMEAKRLNTLRTILLKARKMTKAGRNKGIEDEADEDEEVDEDVEDEEDEKYSGKEDTSAADEEGGGDQASKEEEDCQEIEDTTAEKEVVCVYKRDKKLSDDKDGQN